MQSVGSVAELKAKDNRRGVDRYCVDLVVKFFSDLLLSAVLMKRSG